MSGQAIILIGNLSDGYRAVGPYPDFDAAADAADGTESWIMTLDSPENIDKGRNA